MLNESKKFLRTAIVYLRFYSRERLNTSSLLEQEHIINDFALKNGYRILKIFREENESSSTFNRPAFQQMLDFIRANPWQVKYVIISDLSRLSLSEKGLQRVRQFLWKNRIKLISVTEYLLKQAVKEPK